MRETGPEYEPNRDGDDNDIARLPLHPVGEGPHITAQGDEPASVECYGNAGSSLVEEQNLGAAEGGVALSEAAGDEVYLPEDRPFAATVRELAEYDPSRAESTFSAGKLKEGIAALFDKYRTYADLTPSGDRELLLKYNSPTAGGVSLAVASNGVIWAYFVDPTRSDKTDHVYIAGQRGLVTTEFPFLDRPVAEIPRIIGMSWNPLLEKTRIRAEYYEAQRRHQPEGRLVGEEERDFLLRMAAKASPLHVPFYELQLLALRRLACQVTGYGSAEPAGVRRHMARQLELPITTAAVPDPDDPARGAKELAMTVHTFLRSKGYDPRLPQDFVVEETVGDPESGLLKVRVGEQRAAGGAKTPTVQVARSKPVHFKNPLGDAEDRPRQDMLTESLDYTVERGAMVQRYTTRVTDADGHTVAHQPQKIVGAGTLEVRRLNKFLPNPSLVW